MARDEPGLSANEAIFLSAQDALTRDTTAAEIEFLFVVIVLAADSDVSGPVQSIQVWWPDDVRDDTGSTSFRIRLFDGATEKLTGNDFTFHGTTDLGYTSDTTFDDHCANPPTSDAISTPDGYSLVQEVGTVSMTGSESDDTFTKLTIEKVSGPGAGPLIVGDYDLTGTLCKHLNAGGPDPDGWISAYKHPNVEFVT